MAERIRKSELEQAPEKPKRLGELIHEAVREAIEAAVHEELEAALGARRYERSDARRGHRNGTKTRTFSGPTGPVDLKLPRGRLYTAEGETTVGLAGCPSLPASHGRDQRGRDRHLPRGHAALTHAGCEVHFGHC